MKEGRLILLTRTDLHIGLGVFHIAGSTGIVVELPDKDSFRIYWDDYDFVVDYHNDALKYDSIKPLKEDVDKTNKEQEVNHCVDCGTNVHHNEIIALGVCQGHKKEALTVYICEHHFDERNKTRDFNFNKVR